MNTEQTGDGNDTSASAERGRGRHDRPEANRSFSAEIKDYLRDWAEKKGGCCISSFEEGKTGLERSCRCKRCAGIFLGGVFCAYGSMNSPEKGYYLSLTPPTDMYEYILSVLNAEELIPNTGVRNGKRILYYRNNQLICDFLAYINASPFAIKVAEAYVIRSLRNEANRRVNAEMANIDRVSTSVARQLAAIKILENAGKLDSMPEDLREIARVRTEHPYCSLSELKNMFSFTISKSCLVYKLKLLEKEAGGCNGVRTS